MLYFGIVVIARVFSARSNPLVIGRLLTLDSQGDCIPFGYALQSAAIAASQWHARRFWCRAGWLLL